MSEEVKDSVLSEEQAEQTTETPDDVATSETAVDNESSASPEGSMESDADAAAEVDDKKSDKKKKKDKKDKRDQQIEELNDQLLRQRAEFVNFRNRTEREKAQMFEVGAKSVLEKILPVVDNFERGLATLSDEQLQEPFAQGIDKTYKQLLTVLTEIGVTPIEAVGSEFDPNLHNAVMHVEDDSVGENIVVEEFLKGYRYRDSVLRFSMVKVAN